MSKRTAPFILTDGSAPAPKNCIRHETVTFEDQARPPPDRAQRQAVIDALVEEARARRAAREEAIRALEARALELRHALIAVRLELADARERLRREKFRWTAFLPGNWITRFADPRELEGLKEDIAFLEREEKRLIEAARRRRVVTARLV